METPTGHDRNADQIAFWNGPSGQHWTHRQPAQDIVLAPVLEALIDRAAAKPGERVLDVGCGCGSTSIALAERVAPSGFVLGVDISVPMLSRARQLAPNNPAARLRAGGRHGLSLRSRKLRSPGLALRRDVLRRARGLLCQLAQSVAAVGPCRIRLLARAARKSLDHGAAAGRLQHVPKLPQQDPRTPAHLHLRQKNA